MSFWILFVVGLAGLVLAVGLGVLAARSFIAASDADDPARPHR